ncbi:MAG TPA: type II toxin-antitoxin system VapC family toxin [Thermoanaerobaculia bacterium]|nr:type II toxin-antitoxin system VapC family toxin [Thermoanaerobaculia bacterium]
MIAPRSLPLLGVDSMAFVYHFEGNAEHGPAASALLAAAEEGRCRLAASTLALLEILVVPKRMGQGDLCRRYRDLLESFPNLDFHPLDADIAETAAELRARYDLRTPDSIHLATALVQGAGAFASEDRRLRRVKEIDVVPLAAALAG